MIGGSPQTPARPQFEHGVPVIVVGGGASGAVAALAARAAGAEVLLIEQDASPAGTTSMSQGLVCAAGTQAQAAAGIADDAETLFADIMVKTRGQTDPVIARAIAEGAGPCVDWLASEFLYPFALDAGFRAAYGHTRQRLHGWPGHGGADMVQFLHAKLAERGVDVLLQARLIEIVAEELTVAGIVVERPDGAREAIGCAALVLACGGFAANHAMVAANMPEAAAARHHGHEGNRGDGIRLGAAIGAALGDMGSYQGYAMLADPHGITVPPGLLVEGGIILNRRGERFTNEVIDIAGMVHPVLTQPDGTAWVVIDARIEAHNAYTLEVQALRANGAIRNAADPVALAAVMGADAAAISEALADVNAAASSGRNDAQGRNWADTQPPQWPLQAIRVCGAIYHTQGGLQIDGEARVLGQDGARFANLFASGGAARGVSGPSYWGYLPAMGLGSAVTLGRIAGMAAAAVVAA
ncbi:MAG: FAD-dependent oxidoreductase [Sandarakinorhabdus sp.]|nr:FAD-dependent oxidoreductase [Sandarakinorhabdus sp.]